MSNEDRTIEDELREAMAATIDDTTAADVVADEVVETTSDRDENGRFKSKDKTEPSAEAAVEQPPTDDEPAGKWSPDRPPSSWKPKAREGWANLPLEVREEIIRREENHNVGAAKLQEQFAPLKELQQYMAPVINELNQLGVSPQQHLDRVLGAERVLRTADLPTRFEALMGIADDYGIPLRDIINKSVGQEVLQSPQPGMVIPEEIRSELAEIRAWREGQEQTIINNEVESFGSNLEFFGDVRVHMAELLERGVASDLQDAYDKAIWMNPEIREVMQSRMAQPQVVSPVATRQAKAVGVSVKPSGSVAVEVDDENDSIGETLRKAFNSASGRL